MTVDTKEVVTTIAYMIGVRMSALTVSYGECSELIEKLRADRDATTIRYLCKLRTVLMQKFKKTDDLMRYQLKNLYNIEWYDHDNIIKSTGKYNRILHFVYSISTVSFVKIPATLSGTVIQTSHIKNEPLTQQMSSKRKVCFTLGISFAPRL